MLRNQYIMTKIDELIARLNQVQTQSINFKELTQNGTTKR